MSEGTTIGWTKRPGTIEATLNPIRARLKSDPRKVGWFCEKVSEGCRGCYAEAINRRFGTLLEYKPGLRDLVELYLDEAVLLKPLKWKKPHTIFWCSMTDAFGRFVEKAWNDRMLAVIALTPQHHHIVLTKREWGAQGYLTDPETPHRVLTAAIAISRAHGITLEGKPHGEGEEGIAVAGFSSWPLCNLFVGFSAERQIEFDNRWAAFKHIASRGWRVLVSLEPLIGPVVLPADFLALGPNAWAIPGGGSNQRGYRALHCSPDWVYLPVRQCREAGVPVFVKQMGSAWASLYNRGRRKDAPESDASGQTMACWPERIRVQEWPS